MHDRAASLAASGPLQAPSSLLLVAVLFDFVIGPAAITVHNS